MADSSQSNLRDIHAGILKKDACVVIIRTAWNAGIVDVLEKGAVAKLRQAGMKKIISHTVPGAFELPFAAKHCWASAPRKSKPDAIIVLGCVIRGDTPHFDYVCRAVTDGILQLNLALPIPVIFGVLTVEDTQQAEDRAGGKHGNKGEEFALTALHMIQWVSPRNRKKSLKQ
jgi:6,7-dimethyl-8-ribityllumazine synthase